MLKVRKIYHLPDSAFQRVSLMNSNTPGRFAKAYHVSYSRYANKRGTVGLTGFNGRETPNSSWRDLAGLDLSFIPESSDAIFEPFEMPGLPALQSEVQQLLLDKLAKAKSSDFNAALAIGEFNKTLGMFANTATRLFRCVSALKRGDLRNAYKALAMDYKGRVPKKDKVRDRASNYFLEMRYGWMPTLMDLDAACRKLAHEVVGRKFYTVRAKANAPVIVERRPIRQGGTLITRREGSILGVLTYAVENERIALASSLGFTNPMALAWEATPLSFVFDWLIPVGDWLTRLSATHGLVFVDGSITRKGSRTELASYPGFQEPVVMKMILLPGNQVTFLPDYQVTHTDASVYVQYGGFHRSPLGSFPSVTAPSFRRPQGLTKALVALALINQRR